MWLRGRPNSNNSEQPVQFTLNSPAVVSLNSELCGRVAPVDPGRPLVSHEVIIELIANTTTKAGLKIRAALDDGHYPTGVSVSDAEWAALNLKRANFHGEWNYTLLPTRRKK